MRNLNTTVQRKGLDRKAAESGAMSPCGLDDRASSYFLGRRLIKFQCAQKPEKDKRGINCYSTKFAQELQRDGTL